MLHFLESMFEQGGRINPIRPSCGNYIIDFDHFVPSSKAIVPDLGPGWRFVAVVLGLH
jgi:hypothetical protein